MAFFAFYPAASHLRRPDGRHFVLAEGATEADARAIAQTLVGSGSVAEWTAVEVATGLDPVLVQGLPVGPRSGGTWPVLTRGGGFLNDVA